MSERIVRIAARPLLRKLVTPLEADDLYQVGRIALWQHGQDKPEPMQMVIARNAMVEELRRHRWVCRGDYGDDAAWEMTSHDAWEGAPEVRTDCQAASVAAVLQCIAKIEDMKARDKEVLECLVYGMTVQEIAEHVGLTASAVYREVTKLRLQMEDDLQWSDAGVLGRLAYVTDEPIEAERSDNAAGLSGVTLSGARWRATIRVGGRAGRDRSLGTFDTPEEAHAAYRAARRRYFGR